MKRKLMAILIVILLMILSGCMQMTSNYRIFSDGTYQSEIEILIAKEIYDDPDTNARTYLEDLLSSVSLDGYIKEEETIDIDGEEYYRLTMVKKRSDVHDASLTIEIENGEALFIHDISTDDDFLLELDALGLGSNYKEVLTMQGFVILERIQMPGVIESANAGTISGDILTVDLMANDISKIIVRSKIASNLSSLFVILIIVVALLITLITIYINLNRKRKKHIAEDDVSSIDTALEELKADSKNDILDTLALEEEEDKRDFPY